MKKVLMSLVIASMAMGMAACSDDGKSLTDTLKDAVLDGDNEDCLTTEPKLVAESKNFDTAVKADGVTITKVADPDDATKQLSIASDCEKYATNMAAYLDDDAKREALLEAIKDYPRLGTSLLGVLCTAIDSMKVYAAATTLAEDIDVGNNCIKVNAGTENSEWKTKLGNSLNTLTSADGMTNVLNAAASAAADSASGNNGNGNGGN